PLGSCTMKLNAAVEMEPITWPEFASIHPFAPAEKTQGWRTLITRLEDSLTAVTGYHRVPLQPNAGSQVELARPLSIRSYHPAHDQPDGVDVISAHSGHGANAASAAPG